MAEEVHLRICLHLLYFLDFHTDASDRSQLSRWPFHLSSVLHDILVHTIRIFCGDHILLRKWLLHGSWFRGIVDNPWNPVQSATAANLGLWELRGAVKQHSSKDEEARKPLEYQSGHPAQHDQEMVNYALRHDCPRYHTHCSLQPGQHLGKRFS